jgi:2-C-methyl-D-erythritol 4-phosphate cytidylyltransferase/2-C-methyl-D-erythritol 2,4-cyclodiphosphate synthase
VTANAASRLFALVPAAGGGSRFGAPIPKQYARLAGRPLLAWTLARLRAVPDLHAIVVALAPDDNCYDREIGARDSVTALRCGGRTRSDTVRNALQALAGTCRDDDWILVHDAARPCVPQDALARLVAQVGDDAVGGLLAIPVADTLKRAEGAGDAPRVLRTENRGGLWQAQTPQMFRYGVLVRALAQPAAAECTDEAQAPHQPQGHLSRRPRPGGGDSRVAGNCKRFDMTLRIGNGFDVHALAAGRPLILGGVTIPHTRGLAGHSDADVLLHAIADAILGALALGDLGKHFPDTDPRWRGADSRALLRHVFALAFDAGWELGNVDATLIAQAPKIAPHVSQMRANIAQDLACDEARVSVKATTTEHLGFTGREEGIAALATVLLRLRDRNAGP